MITLPEASCGEQSWFKVCLLVRLIDLKRPEKSHTATQQQQYTQTPLLHFNDGLQIHHKR